MRKALLTSLLFLCGSVTAEAEQGNTLESIYKRDVRIQDQRISGDADARALQAYEAYLKSNPSAANSPDAMRRLANLRLKKYLKALESDVSSQAELKENIAGQRKVIGLYKQILKKYPSYTHNDDVLYQMARAYESVGQPEEATSVLNTLIKKYPSSDHYDESQFRMGEMYFTKKHYRSASNAYGAVINYGESSPLYQQALFKKGWSLFKIAQYEESLRTLMLLMDVVTRRGLHGELVVTDDQRLKDTLRVIALNFYYLGGAREIDGFLKKNGGPRFYEDQIYKRLAELYLEKDIFLEAAATYKAFLKRNKFSRGAAKIHEEVIALYDKGGYIDDVLKEKARLAENYDLDSEFWRFYKPRDLPEVIRLVEATIRELAHHYHASWKETGREKDFKKASYWYEDYLDSFHEGQRVYGISFEYAELLYEKEDYFGAFKQFEKTAYDYPPHRRSPEAGFASLQSYEKYIEGLREDRIATAKVTSVNSYLKFAYAFPQYKEAPNVVKTAAQRLYDAEDYAQSAEVAQMYIERYPNVSLDEQRAAWSLMASASFKAELLHEAELAYHEVLKLTDPSDKRYQETVDQLAATIYQQGAKAEEEGDLRKAVAAYMRVKEKAPFSDLALTAEYDAATVYIKLENFGQAIASLENIRRTHPDNQYADDIVRKLAIIYDKNNQPGKSADEYLAIARTDDNQDTQRDAMLKAASLYDKAGNKPKSLVVYRQFVDRFPKPVEDVIEVMNDIATIYKSDGNTKEYYTMLKKIIRADTTAGAERSDRTRYLAAKATIEIATPRREAYNNVALTAPLQTSLAKKQKLFQSAVKAYELANSYNIAEVTTEATYQIGNIYYDFSKSLMNSEKPRGLSALEIEQYDILLEEQAYPFEEQAMAIFETNITRMHEQGLYNEWIKKTLAQLAVLLPYKYDKQEMVTDYVTIQASPTASR